MRNRVIQISNRVNKTLTKVCNILDIKENITWYSARDTFISRMVDAGCSQLLRQKMSSRCSFGYKASITIFNLNYYAGFEDDADMGIRMITSFRIYDNIKRISVWLPCINKRLFYIILCLMYIIKIRLLIFNFAAS